MHFSAPNRSLGPKGRRGCLAAIGGTTLVVAFGASLLGAWPVMPFAGLEVALLWFAFRTLQRHDADFERLEIGATGEVRLEARDASRETSFVAQRGWARVVLRERGHRCTLGLAYAGRTVPLGRMLSDDGRRELAATLRPWLKVAAD
ncbi:hypothetical protein BWI17_03400 [Betaproteobacteria bacterium GR16-43]|nr:hypothetical protein BWI17_03400 [Betaproteobacteria bacterium GR16-43]